MAESLAKPLLWVLTQRLAHPPTASSVPAGVLSLTAHDRARCRRRLSLPQGDVLLQLPRGTVLHQGDWLGDADGGVWVQVEAQPEPVYWVTAPTGLGLLQGAYHLGNRHVPLQITPEGLLLERDPVLRGMLEQLGLQVTEAISPFDPELGAYGSSHGSHGSHEHH